MRDYPRMVPVPVSECRGLTTPLCTAELNCRRKIVRILLAHGAGVKLRDMLDKCAIDYGLDRLIRTKDKSRFGRYRALLHTLLKSMKNLSCSFTIDRSNDNSLYRACAVGLYDVAEDLLGNDVFLECSSCVFIHYALSAACRENNDQLVANLLINQANRIGVESALRTIDFQYRNSDDLFGRTLPETEAETRINKMVAMLIQAGAADVRQADRYGNSALHAVRNAAVALVLGLIHNGAIVNALNMLMWTPLHKACDREKFDVRHCLRTARILMDVKSQLR